ncbi:MAG: nucleoside 2-deoxyribosyltransferase [Anaerolineae bacterium]|nr:nucleoside 2-deoxyribosyltransferase [Anaerolineae bacterium]MCA9908628.1 nucleoside 2-deoxyribosyltransferase [Anaerolineae bacterium]
MKRDVFTKFTSSNDDFQVIIEILPFPEPCVNHEPEPKGKGMPHAYIAGPLFDEGERWFDEQIDQVVREAGFTTFLPHRDGFEAARSDLPGIQERVFREDVGAIDSCDIIVANLNGVATDDGTAWELGYGFARGKHIVGVYTDWRTRMTRFPDQTLNIMLQCSLNHLCRSLDDLAAYLRKYAAE